MPQGTETRNGASGIEGNEAGMNTHQIPFSVTAFARDQSTSRQLASSLSAVFQGNGCEFHPRQSFEFI